MLAAPLGKHMVQSPDSFAKGYKGSMPHAKLCQFPLFSSLTVKPDPPESVVAKPVPNNPRRLEVSWQNPSSWPDPESFPLKFFLRYRPLILDQWQHVSDAALPGM